MFRFISRSTVAVLILGLLVVASIFACFRDEGPAGVVGNNGGLLRVEHYDADNNHTGYGWYTDTGLLTYTVFEVDTQGEFETAIADHAVGDTILLQAVGPFYAKPNCCSGSGGGLYFRCTVLGDISGTPLVYVNRDTLNQGVRFLNGDVRDLFFAKDISQVTTNTAYVFFGNDGADTDDVNGSNIKTGANLQLLFADDNARTFTDIYPQYTVTNGVTVNNGLVMWSLNDGAGTMAFDGIWVTGGAADWCQPWGVVENGSSTAEYTVDAWGSWATSTVDTLYTTDTSGMDITDETLVGVGPPGCKATVKYKIDWDGYDNADLATFEVQWNTSGCSNWNTATATAIGGGWYQASFTPGACEFNWRGHVYGCSGEDSDWEIVGTCFLENQWSCGICEPSR